MAQSAEHELRVVSLSPDNVDDIFALHVLARSLTPAGFMAIRSKEEYQKVFSAPDTVGVGIRDGDSLVAYAIAHRIDKNPYAEIPPLSAVDPAASVTYHGDGWTVHPDYQRRGIGQRLFELRFQRLAERGADHYLALAAVDNLSSIAGVFQTGSILVGLASDETAMNYVVYWGRLRDRLKTGLRPITIDSGDLEEQEGLFMRGFAARRLVRSNAGLANAPANWKLEFLPAL